MRLPAAILLSAALPAAIAQAAAPVAQMKSQTPLIILAFKQKDGGTGTATGSGFFVSSDNIVTNWHVCCNLPENVESQVLLVGRSKEELQKATVRWFSREKDLAVLQLEKGDTVAPVTFARFPSLAEGMDVWAVGYPGAAGRMAKAEGVFRSSLTKGVISKMDTRAVANGQESVKLIQTDASINAGNSGGPLFDTCGRVVGVNVTKALVTVLDAQGKPVRVPEADGIGWSVDIRELLPELDKLSIRYQAFDSVCEIGGPVTQSGATSSIILGLQITLLVLTLIAGMVILRKKVAPAIATAVTQRRFSNRPPPAVPPAAPSPARAPSPAPAPAPGAIPKPVVRPRVTLLGLTGEYTGQRLPLLVQGLTFGRDAAVSNIVFSPSTPGISKRHCRVYFQEGRIYVEDTYSSHGTFLGTGERIAAGQPREIQSGDEIRLASEQIAFRLERN